MVWTQQKWKKSKYLLKNFIHSFLTSDFVATYLTHTFADGDFKNSKTW